MLSLLIWIFVLSILNINGEYCDKDKCEDDNGSRTKTILFWTHFYGKFDFEFGFGRKPFIEAGCRVNNCWATADKTHKDAADAILFHMRNVNAQTTLPGSRTANQRYVFFLMEHPYHQWNDLRQWGNFFNTTMTYRLDSDVPVRYGRTEPLKNQVPQAQDDNVKKYGTNVSGNRKLVAWFVSNCKSYSKREEYVKELQKFIPVDIYGDCGPLQCPTDKTNVDKRQHPSCYQMLEQNYQFYLSFENIHCKDYVTEKLFNILEIDTVPVVMGGANYSQLAPPKSFIHVDDFKSPQQLAEFLLRLSDSPSEYWSYKQWRATHRLVGRHAAYKEAFCGLCELLHDENLPPKQYKDLHGWWGKDTDCDRQAFDKMKASWNT